jgi:hypothetical protein
MLPAIGVPLVVVVVLVVTGAVGYIIDRKG